MPEENKTILIIDDSSSIREQIAAELKAAKLFGNILHAGDGIDALKTLASSKVDMIICDLEMPRLDGFKLLGTLSGKMDLREIPVIMLTGRSDRDLKIRMLGMGACDYVTKPFDAGELLARVKVQLKILSLQDELKQSNEMLRKLSNTDPLTKLYNRRHMMELLEREWQRSSRKDSEFSVVMIDLDHFKHINDTYGHQNGDQLLIEIAALTAKTLRKYDFVARYGGEEFLLALPETDHSGALILAERLRSLIQSHQFSGDLAKVSMTASMGISTHPTEGINSVYDLIRSADTALYKAKATGRNRVCSMIG